MVPKVKVPTDFGRHHIGSRSHSNMVLKMKAGKELSANSMILSFNSPIIDGLTTNLEITSLDVDEFEEPAVNSFIDAMYSGGIERLNKDVFRDVYKMANVFEVSWLVDRCGKYFEEHMVQEMSGECYEEMLFTFEIARYVSEHLKKEEFIELTMQKINSVDGARHFIVSYLKDLGNLSKSQLSLMIQLAGNKVDIIVQTLAVQLDVVGATFSSNSKYLLENCNLSTCHKINNDSVFHLFNVLQRIDGLSIADMTLLLNLYMRLTSDNVEEIPQNSTTSLPNIFLSIPLLKDYTSLSVFIDYLGDSKKVKNLYMVFDALFMWFCESPSAVDVVCSDEHLNQLVSIKQQNGWSRVQHNCYYEFCNDEMHNQSTRDEFFNALRGCEKLVSNDTDCEILCSKPESLNTDQFLQNENKLMFYFEHRGATTTRCSKPGKCGFILKTTPLSEENPDTFDISLCTNSDDYPQDLHLHSDLISANKMHVALEFYEDGKWYKTGSPITWCGKLCWTGHSWGWGLSQHSNNPLYLACTYLVRVKIYYNY